jgi:hypothetical protein
LDGASQTLPELYKLSADFHDITSGSNGATAAYTAGPGYDLVTGIGSPIGNKLVPAMVAYPAAVMAISPATSANVNGLNFGAALTISMTCDTTSDWGNPKRSENGGLTTVNASGPYNCNTAGLAHVTHDIVRYAYTPSSISKALSHLATLTDATAALPIDAGGPLTCHGPFAGLQLDW